MTRHPMLLTVAMVAMITTAASVQGGFLPVGAVEANADARGRAVVEISSPGDTIIRFNLSSITYEAKANPGNAGAAHAGLNAGLRVCEDADCIGVIEELTSASVETSGGTQTSTTLPKTASFDVENGSPIFLVGGLEAIASAGVSIPIDAAKAAAGSGSPARPAARARPRCPAD